MIDNDFNRRKKIIIFIAGFILLLLSLAVILLIRYNKDKKQVENKEEDIVFIKNYKVNEYIPVYITDNEMCNIYLNDLYNKMINDVDTAYKSMNKKYRENRFKNIGGFKEFINSLDRSKMRTKKYAVESKGEYDYYFIYDEDNNEYIFKTNGVLQYEIYFDQGTVDIYTGEEL